MIAVLSKPADQIGVSDLNELIDSEVPESDQIEFKETLSTKDGSPDRWITHRDRIGEKARNQILEETVAFANAYGGALLLGIRESESRPPVAAEIKPIPRCADLAERLKLKFRDCVEPQIPLIEIFAVPTDGDCGVVVIRTSRSRMAPHRVIPTGKCPIRRSDRCEEMTMREIQDLTLNLSRGLERLERQLEARSELFEKEFDRLTTPDDAWGIRATAAPVGEDIRFDRVYGVADLCTPWREVSLILTLPPKMPSILSRVRSMGGDGHETEQVSRGTDHRHPQRAPGGVASRRALPQVRGQRRDVLQVAVQVRRHGGIRRQEAEGAGG